MSGHLRYGVHELFDKKPYYITIVRDPLERAISLYHHIIREKNHQDYEKATSLKIDMFLKHLIERKKRKFYSQCNIICLQDSFECASKKLEAEFLLYCENSQLDEMIYIFEHFMNQIPSEKLFERANTRPTSQKLEAPRSETIEYFTTKFSYDLKLVEHCRLKFRQAADRFYQDRNILPWEVFKSNLG